MQKILFTGARSGIASKVIDKIKDKDYYIYVTVLNDKQLECVKEKYKDYNNIECFKLDITTDDKDKLKEIDIDILVNNAAICYGGSISEIDMNKVRENFEVNVFSSFEVVQIVLKNMIRKKKGKIIIMSSLAGIMPIKFMGVYASTKASVIKLTTTLKKEIDMLSKNIDICMIEPGFYHTGFNQVMFENKYDKNYESYFREYIKILRERDNFITNFIEKKRLDSIVNKIEDAIENGNKFIYRAPFSQVVVAKLYQLFCE